MNGVNNLLLGIIRFLRQSSKVSLVLEEEADTVLYPDVSAKLPQVTIEQDEEEAQEMTDDPKPNF